MVLNTLQTVGLLVGIAYYLIIMRNTQRTRELTLQSQELTRKAQEQALETRQAQLFMQIFNEYRKPEQMRLFLRSLQMTWDDYDDFLKRYGSENYEKREPFSAMSHFFDGVGILLDEGLVNLDLVARLIHGDLKVFWEKYKPVILEFREKWNNPHYLENMEYLYNEVKRIRGPKWEEIIVPDLKT
jgi:hypothetical protein